MSPLRPGWGFVHPRTPRPPAVRAVRCPFCSHRFEASQRAMMLRCPRCTSPLRLEDLVLRHPLKGVLDTAGQVRITSTSVMHGQIACGHLVNSGRFEGTARVHGAVDLLADSLTTGEIRAQSLRVFLGATLRGKARIGPIVGGKPLRTAAVKGPGAL